MTQEAMREMTTTGPKTNRPTARMLLLWVPLVELVTSPANPPVAAKVYHCGKVREALHRAGPRLAATVTGDELTRATRWINAALTEGRALGPLGASAVLWAAVATWDDAGVAPWSTLARATEGLARAMEPAGAAIDAAKAADALRGRMEALAADLWPAARAA